MHVLFLTYHFPEPEQPGAFRPWVEARLLRDMGYEVTVITSATHYMTGKDLRSSRRWCEERYRDGIRVLWVWAPGAHRRTMWGRLANYIAYGIGALVAGLFYARRPDIVFAGTDPVTVGPAAYLLSRAHHADLVLDERDLYPETAIALGVLRKGFLSRAIFRLQELWRRRARGILAATPGIARALESYGHAPSNIRVMLNADPFLQSKRTAPPETGCDLPALLDRPFAVAYAGGLGQSDDLQTLLNAAELLRYENKIGIAIIGEGERRPSYEAFCRVRGLSGVRFLGAKPRNETRALLASADVCVCLYCADTLFNGTIASKIFDYLALGKPVVFAGSGDTAALLKDAGAAIVVPSGDAEAVAAAIRKLHANPDLEMLLGATGRAWYGANVSPAAAMRTLRQIFRSKETASLENAMP